MRYLVISFILAIMVSCIGGKSKPIEYFTLATEGSSNFQIYVREVSAGAKVHDRIHTQSGSRVQLREFERWEDAPRRLIEVEMKKYFALGEGELRSELNEFVFDEDKMEARITMDFVYTGKGETRKVFRLKSAESFESADGESLSNVMSKALTKIFVQLDQKLNE